MISLAQSLTNNLLKASPFTFQIIGDLILSSKDIQTKSSYRCSCGEDILRIIMQDKSMISIHMHRNTNQLDILYFHKISQFDERMHKHLITP